ncbi:ribulose-phosphate 3-epimerase [Inconstantimicrobium mannanitabidum]|uniref:Ribulose-phosphate 3-epimerase n=1 Tax=Inconstantimicrobium mannanitabidum TaxID=1604901 RepID=A0ACB5RAP9_9CLOT|nr:ribulose-phosphate 3-epimerase [Clostridium sp. TW13]GKX66262.1 ribulose-phosphate 3-epimerase [Clostridium sp. TW13]
MVILSPSILAADFKRLGEQVSRLDKSGAEFIHIDVMDGNFVPNISLGFPVIKSIREITKKVFDVHLMIEQPSKYIDEFIACGADMITIHYEADKHIDRTINYIKSKGCKVGIALNPGTPTCVIKDLIPQLDMVLIMSVNPGFGGQKFIEYSKDKIKEVSLMAKNIGKDLLIEVDGGVDPTNIKSLVECGANVLVAGSAVFKDDKIEENIDNLRKAL